MGGRVLARIAFNLTLDLWVTKVQPGQRAYAFTIVELLVVVSLIMLLIALLLPALGHARESARRAVCVSNVRQWTVGCLNYAPDNQSALPLGRRTGADSNPSPGADDYVWIRYSAWTTLRDSYGLTEDASVCASVGREPWMFTDVNGGNGYVGLIYWGNRSDHGYDPLPYTTPKRVDDPHATSTTLATCFHYDSYAAVPGGHPWGSRMPHVGVDNRTYAANQPVTKFFDGLAVAHTDGRADWAPFESLSHYTQVDVEYYEP